MSYGAAPYLMQFVPILIGAALMMMLRRLRLNREVLRIRNSFPTGRATEASGPCMKFLMELPNTRADYAINSGAPFDIGQRKWRDCVGDFDDLRSSGFDRSVYDGLLSSGLLKRAYRDGLRETVLRRFGAVDIRNIWMVSKRSMPQELKVFAVGGHELLDRSMTFGRDAGVLLAYLSAYKLSAVGDSYGASI